MIQGPQNPYDPYNGYYPPAPHYPVPGHPGYYPIPYPPVRTTNNLAIIALVSVFIFGPVGLILGIMARNEIKRTHQDGEGLAIAAIILGGLSTLWLACMVIFIFSIFTFS